MDAPIGEIAVRDQFTPMHAYFTVVAAPTFTPTNSPTPLQLYLLSMNVRIETLDPASGPPGINVNISGNCYYYHSGRTGEIYFDDIAVTTVSGDTGGDFSGNFTVPMDATPGMHIVYAAGSSSYMNFLCEVSAARADLNGDKFVDGNDLLLFQKYWMQSRQSVPTATQPPVSTNTPTFTPTETPTCIPEWAWLYRNLPDTCEPGETFDVTFTTGGGTAAIQDVTETVPTGWTILSSYDDRNGDTYHWNGLIWSYTIMTATDALPGIYTFYGYTDSHHECNGHVQWDIQADSTIECIASSIPTITPTPGEPTATETPITHSCSCEFPRFRS